LLEEVTTLIAGQQGPDDEQPVRIVHRVEAGLPPAAGDRWRLLQALGNLIVNAVRHSPRGGLVEVLARRASGRSDDSASHIRFAVVDRGPGIDPELRPRLFEPFQQGASSDGTKGGAGLGLAIVRGIVEAHGGEVWVESEPGEGASFYFTVPVAIGASVIAAE
jgi:signal transduction histidine kinase